MSFPTNQLPVDVLDALQRGNTIEAIKLLRDSSGLGLKEAKDAIDAHLRGDPVSMATATLAERLPASVQEALQRGNKIEAIQLLREQSGLGLKEAKDVVDGFAQEARSSTSNLSPGEEPRQGNNAWVWVVVLIVAAVIAYFFMRGGG